MDVNQVIFVYEAKNQRGGAGEFVGLPTLNATDTLTQNLH